MMRAGGASPATGTLIAPLARVPTCGERVRIADRADCRSSERMNPAKPVAVSSDAQVLTVVMAGEVAALVSIAWARASSPHTRANCAAAR
jgi:hypothetical protein